MRSARLIAVLVGGACVPSSEHGSGATNGDHAEESTADAADPGDAMEASAGDGTPGGGADDTGAGDTGELDDACVLADPDACPVGCYRGEILRVEDDACTTTNVPACLPAGEMRGVPVTTFWTQTGAGPAFAEYGSACGAAAQPEGWRECSGAADEPPECACFCQDGYCRGDDDRRVLESCELPATCETLLVLAGLGAADPEVERCLLEHLRDRVPGVYEIFGGDRAGTMRTRFHVVGDELWRMREAAADAAGDECPSVSRWGTAEYCALAPADYFAACLEAVAPGEDCVLMLDAWALDCVEQAPSCD